jgi:threonine/homoserine/homoserine lactone efflux protein
MDQSLWLYFLLVLGIVALPGMDMAYIVSSALAGGARCAVSAIAGVVAGGMVHVLTAAIGLTALLAAFPHALRVLVLLGAAYMAWMGCQFFRTRPATASTEATPALQSSSVFRYGAMTCLVNPKAYAFMLAVFPSFLHSDRGSLALRAAELSGLTVATQIAVYGATAFVALRMHRRFASSPATQEWMQRTVGAIMIVSAAILAHGWL